MFRTTQNVSLLGFLALLLCSPLARGEEAHFLLMFGSQRVSHNSPNYSHTFATFVRLSRQGPADEPKVEHFTISWMPSDQRIQTLRPCAKDGQNCTLEDTLNWCQATGQRISLWGPYCIQPELFTRAALLHTRLNSGAVRFKAFDLFRDYSRVCNCIHALSHLVEHSSHFLATFDWGDSASLAVLCRAFGPYLIDPSTRYPELLCKLGLQRYPIVCREGR